MMGKPKGATLTLQKCDLCDFTSKNVYIFKRHRVSCKKKKYGGFANGEETDKREAASSSDFIETDTIEGQDKSQEVMI